ncbi:HNH endonuclease signature motif containing protein [Phycisphaeraceae bacterium D3-23]
MNAREIRKLITVDDLHANCKLGKRGCWVWTGPLHSDGYGAWNAAGRQVKAHRASYLLQVGPIPRGRFVTHTCDNKRCINPDHLHLVTHKTLYLHNKKNGHVARGERNGFATLTAKDVRRIRKLAKAGKYPHRTIGDMVGCHQTNVTRILNGTYWAHLK